MSEAAEVAEVAYDFDADFIRCLVALNLRDGRFGVRTDGLVRPEYFEGEADRALVRIANEYRAKHKTAPGKGVVGTVVATAFRDGLVPRTLVPAVKARLAEVLACDMGDADFIAAEVARFARGRAMELCLMRSAEERDRKGVFDYDAMDARFREAMAVGLAQDDEDYDYWAEAENRAEQRKGVADGTIATRNITTGCAELDRCLHNRGWGRGELNILMAGLKGGKSLAMGDFARAGSMAGHNVLYLSLEVNTSTLAERLDANVANHPIAQLNDAPMAVRDAIVRIRDAGKLGALRLRRLPAYSVTPAQVRRILKEYRAKGIVFDLIVVDYADLMVPDQSQKEDRLNSRIVYAELRNIGIEEDAAILTATQTNRQGMTSDVAKATDVAEDISKGRTCDVFITINTNEDDRKEGVSRLHFAAMREADDGYTIKIRQDRSRMKFITSVLERLG